MSASLGERNSKARHELSVKIWRRKLSVTAACVEGEKRWNKNMRLPQSVDHYLRCHACSLGYSRKAHSSKWSEASDKNKRYRSQKLLEGIRSQAMLKKNRQCACPIFFSFLYFIRSFYILLVCVCVCTCKNRGMYRYEKWEIKNDNRKQLQTNNLL